MIWWLGLVAIIAGAVAALAGFGVGSLLTPLMAIKTGIGVAVAAVSIPHFLGTAVRFVLGWRDINRRVLRTFGLMSAAGGLAGALLHTLFQNAVLTLIFGALMVLAGLLTLTGLSERLRARGPAAMLTGAVSGLLGGLVGHQGGIRSVALLGFNLEARELVATATAVALMVDIARVPVYLALQWHALTEIWQYILVMVVGVLLGIVPGKAVLAKLPEGLFKKVVGALILAVGILVLIRG